MKKSVALVLLMLFIACKTTPKKEGFNAKTNLLDVFKKTIKSTETSSALISIKKGECSGDCSEFEVSITKDSLLNYNGLKNVALLGEHQLKLSSKQFLKLEKALKEANESSFSTSYIDTSKSFLPVTNISINETTIKINLWKDAPELLTNLYTFVEDLLYDQKYLEE